MLNESTLIGLVALALVPLIGLRILRGIRQRRLPVYRAYLDRHQAGAIRFNLLLGLHVLSLLLIALVAADLLLGLGIREQL